MANFKAQIGEFTVFGEYCVIADDVIIGKNCVIGNHVVIHSGTKIGNNVRIDDFACIGKLPMKAANSAVTKEHHLSPANIGSGCIIGTHVVIYRGCTLSQNCLVADLATVRENVTIGEKTIVGRGVCIENKCSIGSFCKLETNAYICAYSEISNYCLIAPCVVTSNDNFAGRTLDRFEHFGGLRLCEGGRIGAGAVILPGKEISEDGFVAAGSVVTKNVPSGIIVAGNPAKQIKAVPKEQLLNEQLKSSNN
jgi:UDP-2-acetamido-3-amino-2,3-dideoxy-glucuronate N-acetyltransferase